MTRLTEAEQQMRDNLADILIGAGWSATSGAAFHDLGEAIPAIMRELEIKPQVAPEGYALMPIEPTHEILSAMATSKARDDEGEFPMMLDLLDYSGENKTHTVLKAVYVAAIAIQSTKGESDEQA